MKSVYILGINAFHADASAVLLRDGQIVGAIAEERLNRVKHFAGFPQLAIRELLQIAGITIDDVQHIAIGRDSKANVAKKLGFSLSNLSRIGKLAKQRLENRANIRDIPTLVAEACGIRRDQLAAKVHHIEHHMCHAASVFLVSPFDRAAIVSFDGFGDFASTMVAQGQGNGFDVLDRVYFPHSLGVFYTALCQLIGYRKYGDEGKVMGLAPYGEPVYLDLMRQLVVEKPSGKFELNLDYFIHHTEGVDYSFDDKGTPTVAPLYSENLVKALGTPTEPGAEISQRDKDIARSMQARLEEVYFHVLNDLHHRTKCSAICMAGGVSLNSVANGKIFKNTPFTDFYAHPAATDDGTAFGAAYYVHHIVQDQPRGPVLRNAYLGNEFSDDEIKSALDEAGMQNAQFLSDDELYPRTAESIYHGKVVGWFQGKMEWGPRALGARSILAHPGLPDMKDILNARIKHREWFRPFAPSILEDRVSEYFEDGYPTPFMMRVLKTVEGKRKDIQATDHVDHTGRLQTVNQDACPQYYRLISEFEKFSGIPVVLNTSFNENEPIVCRPQEAISCYQRTKMDVLVMGHWFLEKPSQQDS